MTEKMSFIKKLTISAKEGTLFKKSNTVSPVSASKAVSHTGSQSNLNKASLPSASNGAATSPSKPSPNTQTLSATKQTESISQDGSMIIASVTTRGVNPANAPPFKPKQKYNFADLSIDRTLGTGSFGRVHLVRLKTTGKYYAMKVLKKNEVVKMKQVEHTINEKNILEKLDYPFLVFMLGTIQDSHNLYFILEYVQGGEVFSFLRRSGRFQNSVAKFYAVEVILAFEYLHIRHVKITDFGFAKHVPDITWTLCGTPDYLAPEIIQSKGYGKAVDWWAFGILLYEMLAGHPLRKILACKPKFPSHFDPNAKDLVKRILTTDLTKRYGNLKAGVMEDCQVPAPYLPPCKGEGDTSNFDQYQEDHEPYGVVGPDPHKDKFIGF
ncbi:kinase-like protein [Rhizoclosmatium globosum]|uniref:cAMP-dependent protein kinase n=1 Tax=Rhizoclosmatium globosum TaxID=329046 RepID=A0A1Y2B9N0_9FUNG|nr:kinase-like protein [Rhizoclosmatium globosum]|eukprot:ORY31200.1 kinase-like protein [Rhizoclosmatium globosum]